MSEPLVVLPDAEDIITAYLDAALPQVSVGTATPKNLAERLPFVQVRRIGGVADSVVIDRPRLDIDVWAATREQAQDTAQLVRAHLRVARYAQHTGAVVGRVTEERGPAMLPDPDTRFERCSFTVQVVLRPTPIS